MSCLESLSKEELIGLKGSLQKDYEQVKSRNLKLDMSRGKPCLAQLDLSLEMIGLLHTPEDFRSENGMDVRNYGMPDGIPEARRLFGEMMGVEPEAVIVGGNSSLNMMFDTVARSMTHGVCGYSPWSRQGRVKFLCPSPGYDRHFAVCEHFGIEMIPVPMDENGPDMDMVERLVQTDAMVKGIWCVPQYSNPTGITYSDEVVRRLAAMTPAAKDFRIFWDNAYCIHGFSQDDRNVLNILDACRQAGHEDMVYLFCSTSKVSFPGAGVAAMAASRNNVDFIKKCIGIQTIGPDKINQLRHVQYFKNLDGMKAHMAKHAAIIKPKFDAVLEILEENLSGLGIAQWTKPTGGYFISFDTMPGCARQVVELCRQAGVVLTPAGASFPYGKDPQDSNIRIAPTFPVIEELRQAAQLFCLCVKIVSIEKILLAK